MRRIHASKSWNGTYQICRKRKTKLLLHLSNFPQNSNVLPWVWVGPSELLLTNRIRQKVIGCHFWDYVLQKVSLSSCLHSLCFLLARSHEASFHVVRCPMERPTWQGTSPPPAQSQWGTETLSSKAHKELNPSNNRVYKLESGLFHSWAFRWLQPRLSSWLQPVRPWATSCSWAPCRLLTHKNWEIVTLTVLSY